LGQPCEFYISQPVVEAVRQLMGASAAAGAGLPGFSFHHQHALCSDGNLKFTGLTQNLGQL
jgi:hypothetical protein